MYTCIYIYIYIIVHVAGMSVCTACRQVYIQINRCVYICMQYGVYIYIKRERGGAGHVVFTKVDSHEGHLTCSNVDGSFR